MACGLFLLYKEQGMTSQTAVKRLSRLFGGEKAGHTGTLDPLAEGVLPVLVGRAVKASEFLLSGEKKYIAEQVSITLSDEVLTFLAENLRSNIRQIEGAIKKLSAIVFLEGKQITMEIAASCLQEISGGVVPVQVIVDKIFSAVFNKYGVGKEDLLSKKRNKDIAFARHVCIYLIREVTEMSYPGIGRMFDRDHTTILSSCDIVSKKIASDAMVSVDISEMLKEVNG